MVYGNPPPYQHHAPQYNAHQSNGFGVANYGNSNTSQPSNSRNQEEKEDALLPEEDVENLNHKEVHECLEEVEEENVDQEVADEDKESKVTEILQSASSEATPPESPSKLHFEWEIDSLRMDESRFITCGELEFKAYNGHLPKLHNNRAKVGASNLKKHLGPWQSQEKLVDSQRNGWTNQVLDPGKSYKNQHFCGVTTCIRTFRLVEYELESHREHEVQALVGIQGRVQAQATITRTSQQCPT
ncbi:hypothetical protein PIB30_076182 [Stylosanthes scabra]|uniref:Uncharacterized protein n=1 Tax=Stylosanthes scabra TaxID=79078 RepID=A0ABU6VTM1_9FABA|nr:hypothetical protein [Stylosanthes scabra]